jgi:Domain of unknown function (DUF932)
VPERFGVGFSAGPGKTCCRNKRQQEEPPVGLEAGSQLKSQGKWLGVGGTFLWDFTYLCWNLTWVPVRAQEQSIRTEARRGFQKHVVRFARVEHLQTWERNQVRPEVVLVNSHDKSSAYQLRSRFSMTPEMRLDYPMYSLLQVLRLSNTQYTVNAEQPGPGLRYKADRLTQ